MKTILLSLLILQSFVLFAQNQVTNGGLESWTSPTNLDNWTIENNVSQNTTDATEGASSALFVITDNTMRPLILALVPMTAGVVYNITYKVKYLDMNYNGAHPITLKIIRAGSGATLSNNSFSSNNDWVSKATTFTPDVTGDYNVSFSIATFDGNGFSALVDDVKVVDSTLGTDDILLNSIKIYPTITKDFVTISNTSNLENLNVTIYNTNGSLLRTETLKGQQINLSHLPSGLYFIKLKSLHGAIIKKVVKN